MPDQRSNQRPKRGGERSQLALGLAFASPWIFGFLVFTAYPIVASLYYSFTYFDTLSPPVWVGAQNYTRLLAEDPLFWQSLRNTLFMVVFGLPASLVAGLALALLLNQKLRGMAIYRTIFYIPSIVPTVASSVLWMWLLNPQIGLINKMLTAAGVQGPGWLTDPAWSKPALILMGIWGVGSAMIIYLAGLQDVSQELYEAAEIDGAGSAAKLFHVTLPMLSPVIFFNLVMGIIGTFQYFTQVFVMTHGGPEDSTLFYALHLFNKAFVDLQFGYASAMAWILFAITIAATALVFRSSARWVYYPGETR
jgi:multiple sugar transport system permease protein